MRSPGHDLGSGGAAPGPSPIADEIAQRAAEHPHRVFLVHARDRRSVTFLQVSTATSHVSALLEEAGVAPGEPVGLVARDPLVFALWFLGVAAAGRFVAPLDPAMPLEAQVASFHRTAPTMVLADRGGPTDGPPWVSLPRRTHDLLCSETKVRTPGRGGPGGVVLTTSGTTGAPKGIELSSRQLMHTARCVADHHGLGPQDVGFNSLPLWHINAEVVGLLASLVAGARLVLDERFRRTAFWSLVGAHHATWVNAVPAMLARLAPLRIGETVPRELRFVRSASAPLAVSTLERFETATGVPVVETYGMTEASSQIAAIPLGLGRKPGSVGMAVGVEIRIRPVHRDEPARPGSPGEPGMIEIRGPGVITSYAHGRAADRFSSDGWLITGDLGELDDDGYLFLRGRVDDVINRGGEKIYPREIEEVVVTAPGVLDVAVVGRPDEHLGAVPVAFVVAGSDAPDRDSLVEGVWSRCRSALPRGRQPAAVILVDSLPGGPNGKVRRRELDTRPMLAEAGAR